MHSSKTQYSHKQINIRKSWINYFFLKKQHFKKVKRQVSAQVFRKEVQAECKILFE